MQVSAHYSGTDLSMPLVEVGRACLERGITGLYLPDHSHYPVRRRQLHPGVAPRDGAAFVEAAPLSTAAAPTLDRYQRIIEPYVGLAHLSAALPDLRLGTCVTVVAQHDPITLAKQVASLDHLSGGRFVMGVGAGWIDEELAHHGHDPSDRDWRLREGVQLMRAFWSSDVVSFKSEHYAVEPSYAWPKPVQPGGPPVLLGCRATRGAFRQLAAWADGWIPMDGRTARTLAGDLALLRSAWAEAGRDGNPRLVVMQVQEDQEALRRAVDTFAEHDVADVLVDVPTDGPAGVLASLDRWRGLLDGIGR